ncbi:hypothetical protein ACOME3_000076 [Neoechinorhynchus agilis]
MPRLPSNRSPDTFLYAPAGLCPYLTDKTVHRYLKHAPSVKEVPLRSIWNMKKLSGFENYKYFVTVRDAALDWRKAQITNFGFPLYCRSGMRRIGASSFNSFIQMHNPHYYQSYYPKKEERIVDGSVYSVLNDEEAMEITSETNADFPTKSISVYNLFERVGNQDCFDKKVEMRLELVSSMRSNPRNQQRILLTPCSPLDVTRLFPRITMFSGCYPYVLTTHNRLMFIDYDNQMYYERPLTMPNPVECKCHACSEYSVDYRSHLLNTNELFGRSLTLLHNMFVYFEFFKRIAT